MCASFANSSTKNLNGKGTLWVTSNNHSTVAEHQLTKPVMSIGRNISSDIVIDEDIVSSYHFQIQEQNGLYYLIHPHPHTFETTNGFSCHGKQFHGKEQVKHLLTNGDTIRIGDATGSDGSVVSIIFDDGSGDVKEIFPPGYTVPLNKARITIGRKEDNDVCLPHETVSAEHAVLEKQGQGYSIVDGGSTNHTFVNGMPVSNARYLNNDDVIQIGPFKLTYTGTMLKCDTNRSIRIEAQNLYKIVKGKGKKGVEKKDRALLRNVSLVIPSRSFVALVGGSGAGKSTLLKALSGLQPAHGMVYYNGYDYYKSFSAFNTQLGYVPQDDIVHRELTVQDALYYGAKLRLPHDFMDQEIHKRIAEVIEKVDLLEHKEKLITKLSGGQRKRVSIALELLADPGVFFLDEPTSGLDPGLDRKMMVLLRELADQDKTIVLVTHATNNINVCDYVCFMGEGRLVYFGPPHQARKFFQKNDFADIYNELDNEVKCEYWSKAFLKSTDYQTYVAKPLALRANSHNKQIKQRLMRHVKQNRPISQWWFLCQRYLKLLKNDRWNLGLLLLQAPIIALIIFSFVWYGIGRGGFDINNVVSCPRTKQVFTKTGYPDVPTIYSPTVSVDCGQLKHILETTPQGRAFALHNGGVQKALQDFMVPGPGDAPIILFIMAFAAVMCGCINSSREIVKEDPIYRRERVVNIGILPYLFSKIAVLGSLCLFQSATLVIIVSFADSFPHGTLFPGGIEVYITIALTSLAGLMLGLMVSALVPNSDRAMSILPLLLLPQVVFSGTLFPLSNKTLQLLGMIFPVRWAMAALGSTVGIHSDKMFGPSGGIDKIIGNDYSYHGTLFSLFSQTNATWHLIYMWSALGISSLLFLCITAIALRWKDRRSFGYTRKKCVQCKYPLSRPDAAFCVKCSAKQF